jgi:hypothetical protein
METDMRDLNLGPESRKLINKYKSNRGKEHPDQPLIDAADNMATMLEHWVEAGWCWVDACPAWICSGPHVKVQYTQLITGVVEVIEPANRAGTTFEGEEYVIITGGRVPPCPCACNNGGFCGGCGHAGCGGAAKLPAARHLQQDGQP